MRQLVCRCTQFAAYVRSGATIKQSLDQEFVALHHREMQRRQAHIAYRVNIGACVNQHLRRVIVTPQGHSMQRSVAVGIPRVH